MSNFFSVNLTKNPNISVGDNYIAYCLCTFSWRVQVPRVPCRSKATGRLQSCAFINIASILVDPRGFGTENIPDDAAQAPAFPVKVSQRAPPAPKNVPILPPAPAFADDSLERDTQLVTVAAPTALNLNTGNQEAGDTTTASARIHNVREQRTQMSAVEIYLAFCFAMWLLANPS